ncbi:MAG: hypothetical protein ACRC4T_17135 [Cetobacterium sp.]
MNKKNSNLYSTIDFLNPQKAQLLAEGKNPYSKNNPKQNSTTKVSKTPVQSASKDRPKMK